MSNKNKVMIIAEVGVNHDGNLDKALRFTPSRGCSSILKLTTDFFDFILKSIISSLNLSTNLLFR